MGGVSKGIFEFLHLLLRGVIKGLMGEGFILLTRGYRLKIGTSTDDIKLKLYK